MSRFSKLISFLFLLLIVDTVRAETTHLNWYISQAEGYESRLEFSGTQYSADPSGTPYFIQRENSKIIAHASIEDAVFERISPEEAVLINTSNITEQIETSVSVVKLRNEFSSTISFIPFRINKGNLEKLVSFSIFKIYGEDHSALHVAKNATGNFADNSVLSEGEWYKIAVLENGVYKLDYAYLTSMSGQFANANINQIRLFGNGGNILPEINNDPVLDDLKENPLAVFDANQNGIFEASDYLYFYGDATDEWNVVDNRFQRSINFYADTSYYFITVKQGAALRHQRRNNSANSPQVTFTSFNERLQHQQNLVNIVKSGREWYGETFDFNTIQDFNFSMPGMNTGAEMCADISLIASSIGVSTSFSAKINGSALGNTPDIGRIPGGYGDKAIGALISTCFNPNTLGVSDNFNIQLAYDKRGNQSAKGYLNHITINAERLLNYSNGTRAFRNLDAGASNSYGYTISGANSDLRVWDITNPIEPINQQISLNGNNASFTFDNSTGQIHEFYAFTTADFKTPLNFYRILNQNLHDDEAVNLVIITHPSFLSEANRLSEFKNSVGITSHVITTTQIYNEYSSGKQDLSALRNYLKMLYDGPNGSNLENVLLFGDCSYDYKYRYANNSNFVPVYESPNSTNDIASHSSDDFIAFLDDGLGAWPYSTNGNITHQMAIGVGRFPCKNLTEAKTLVDKVIFYSDKSNVIGDWLNLITFVADDGDSNLHMGDADASANIAKANNPNINIQKIYIDAYNEIALPSGPVSIDGKAALDRAIQEGTLIVNYSGHGGEIGWTEEQILRLDQISRWENYEKLPFFFTATCSFGRYDDPKVVSGGELVHIMDNGGAIAIMTTTRAVYASTNEALNKSFYNHVFDSENGKALTLGQVIRRTKNNSPFPNNRSFALLGDPSLRLAIPQKKVRITSINDNDINTYQDTLKALCLVNIKGEIIDTDSIKISDFNGFANIKVFDKELTVNTRSSYNLKQYKNLLFQGVASVINGEFSVDFVVPKDIDYRIGIGKISVYAYSENPADDANGSEFGFFIGGSCEGVAQDNDPPRISLFIDDTTFVNGGLTSNNPTLIAFIEDENGINATGTGIGRDITATTNINPNAKFILNDYYRTELDNYKKGSLQYRLKDLPDGKHSLALKAWDTHNNSSESAIEFIVASDEVTAITELMNYPNPFSAETYFSVEHNKAGDDLLISLEIRDYSGQLIKQGSAEITDANTTIDGRFYQQMQWDGTDEKNKKLQSGLYFYKVSIKSKNDGSETSDTKRLILIK